MKTLSHTLISSVSQLQTQQLMTSQVRSHIEYLIQHIICFRYIILKIDEKSSITDGFKYDLMMTLDSDLLFWPPCS